MRDGEGKDTMVAKYWRSRRQGAVKEGEGGFTLIELLIVIVVMGVLAAVVIFALGGVTGKSQVSACNSDAKTVQLAITAYQTQNPPGTGSVSLATLQSGGYLQSLPTSGNGYTIGVTGSGSSETPTVQIGTGGATAYTGSAQCVGA
jgi:prepilin-type N-terminal cleavage/methylation domain-containing protein